MGRLNPIFLQWTLLFSLKITFNDILTLKWFDKFQVELFRLFKEDQEIINLSSILMFNDVSCGTNLSLKFTFDGPLQYYRWGPVSRHGFRANLLITEFEKPTHIFGCNFRLIFTSIFYWKTNLSYKTPYLVFTYSEDFFSLVVKNISKESMLWRT